jgi:hypothetical protein
MMRYPVRLLGVTGLALALALGCEEEPKPTAKARPVETKKVLTGKNVWLEVQKDGPKVNKRVLVSATVCLREGQLELLMCRKQTKEHEAVLSADVDARQVHAALLAAGAEPGHPVTYQPRYKPATGQTIKVSLQYEQKGKQVTVPAQSWVKNSKTGKELESNWVFAGSHLIDNPLDKDQPKIYLANEGDLICVSNFESAMLDLPIKSPKDNADLVFEAFTNRIPPLETPVVVILDPVPEPKQKK